MKEDHYFLGYPGCTVPHCLHVKNCTSLNGSQMKVHYVYDFTGSKTSTVLDSEKFWRIGKTTNWQNTLANKWNSVSAGKTLGDFWEIESALCKQTNSVNLLLPWLLSVNWHHLIESYHMDMVPSCSVNPFGSGKDKTRMNKKISQAYSTSNTSKDFVIMCKILQSRVLFAILPVCCSKLLEG